MQEVVCPTIYTKPNLKIWYTKDVPSLFIAGGISGCEPWQKRFVRLLKDTDITLLNPRRPFFNQLDPNMATEQIEWEYQHLRVVDAISFWFPNESACSSTLFQLGFWMNDKLRKPIFVGAHPEYRCITNVTEQLRLARPDIHVVDTLSALADQVKDTKVWYNKTPNLHKSHELEL